MRLFKVDDLFGSHALYLVNIARSLVITIDLIVLVGMPFGVAAHEVGVLNPAHCLARRVLAGDQVDGLCLPPGILMGYDVFNVADIYGHSVFLLCVV